MRAQLKYEPLCCGRETTRFGNFFTIMLTDILRLLTECKCDLSEAQFFLDDQFDTDKFS